MIVPNLTNLADIVIDGSVGTYEGLPGTGPPASAPLGLFASLLSAEQIALMGGSPLAPSPETVGDAATAEAASGTDGPNDGSAPPQSALAALLAAAGKGSAGTSAEGEAPAATQVGAAHGAAASASPGSAPASAPVTAPETTPAAAVSAQAAAADASGETTASSASSVVEETAVDAEPDVALFAAVRPGRGGEKSSPHVWVEAPIGAAQVAQSSEAAKSTAKTVRLPSPAAPVAAAAQPDTVASGAAVSIEGDIVLEETAPVADAAARSRAEAVRRQLVQPAVVDRPNGSSAQYQTGAAVPDGASGKAPVAPASTASPQTSEEAVQVAQLDTSSAETEAVLRGASSELSAEGVSEGEPETAIANVTKAALHKNDVDAPTAKAVDPTAPVRHETSVHGVSQSHGTGRIAPQADGPPVVQTPVSDFGDTAVKSVRYLVSQGENTMRIKLIPENLGEMQLVVRSVGEALHIHVASAHGHVRDAVEAQLQGLRDQLAKDGIEVTKITVTADASGNQQFAQHSSGRDTFGSQQFARDGTPWRSFGQHGGQSQPEPTWTAAGRQQRQHAGALNLFA